MTIEKWDVLVLTAKNIRQKNLIESRFLPEFCEYFIDSLVIEDWPSDSKIGSGGATINALIKLKRIYGNDELYKKRICILHSGGYSQRLPHAATVGKLFMNLPGGKCLLDIKLKAYLNLLSQIPPGKFGIFIGASDTFESLDALKNQLNLDTNVEIVLFAHESNEKTATNHGVYVLDNQGDLDRVLQKPSVEKLSMLQNLPSDSLSKDKNQKTDGNKQYFTDSCYLIQSTEIVTNLIESREKFGIIRTELCAYGDFLQALGKNPEILISEGDLEKWQKIFREIFYGKSTQILNLGRNTFCHIGTNLEFLENILPSNNLFFCQKFFKSLSGQPQNIIASKLCESFQNNGKSFVEYSEIGENYILEENCLLSRVHCKNTREKVSDSKNPVQHVTVLFPIGCDFKSSSKIFKWFDHEIKCDREESFWTLKIFSIQNCPYKSFHDTVKMLIEGPKFNENKISIWDAIQQVDLEHLEWNKHGQK